jgi:hypothetical protein
VKPRVASQANRGITRLHFSTYRGKDGALFRCEVSWTAADGLPASNSELFLFSAGS